jgi:hypothetical protein
MPLQNKKPHPCADDNHRWRPLLLVNERYVNKCIWCNYTEAEVREYKKAHPQYGQKVKDSSL